MANMNFGVNILPKANNTYSLGNSDYKWNIFANTINGQEINTLGLPSVSAADNGKILQVSNGSWTVATAASSSSPSVFTGATSSAAGTAGLVPAPTTSDVSKFLKGDGTWASADTWGGITYSPYTYVTNSEYYIPVRTSMNGTEMKSVWVSSDPGNHKIAKYNANGYLLSTTPTSSDNSTKVATTAFVKGLLPSTMTACTSSTAGTEGLVPVPSAGDENKFLSGDGTWKAGGLPMVILSYGNSTWQSFMDAYSNNVIVYCRASSNSNPATGSQTRMGFMAYVNDATNPTNVEFQYYRSVNPNQKSISQIGDQVFIYKLDKNSGWSVTTREASIKTIEFASGTNLSASFSGSTGKLTISAT